jgi:hypothetical protein
MVRGGIGRITVPLPGPLLFLCKGDEKINWLLSWRRSDSGQFQQWWFHFANLLPQPTSSSETEPYVKSYIIAMFLRSLILIHDLIYCLLSNLGRFQRTDNHITPSRLLCSGSGKCRDRAVEFCGGHVQNWSPNLQIEIDNDMRLRGEGNTPNMNKIAKSV